MSLKCTVIIKKEEDWYVANDLNSGVASQGKTIDESLANLKDALYLYYEDNALINIPDEIYITTMEVTV